jgi:hypothetical protein
LSRIHQAWEKIPLEGDLQIITADEVRQLTGREPRLMMKFDHTSTLPPVLRDTGRFILPLKNGVYALLKGQGYHQPEWCGPVQEYARQTQFELKTTSAGISEMQHLDIAFNTGLLGHFLAEDMLYPTIRGRKRSPRFAFQAAGHEFEAEGVQVEIDGGFEGRRSVTLVEAKIGECEDFHLRQLYYPVRFWSAHTRKKIRSVFFTYEPAEEIYRFREYEFVPADVYASPQLVKAAAYKITTSPLIPYEPIVAKRDCPFPQADRLDKIAIIPFLASEGHTSPEELATVFEFSPRQGRYYQDACRALGLVNDQGELTTDGQNYIGCSPEVRHRVLCRAVLKLPVMQEILSNLLLAPNRQLSREQVEVVVQRATSLAMATAARRTQTVWAWLSWVSLYCPTVSVEHSAVCIETPQQPQQTEDPLEQLNLF